MNIAFVVDSNYLKQLMFTLINMRRTSIEHHKVFVFYQKLSDLEIGKIQRLASSYQIIVSLIKIPRDDRFFDNGHISAASLIRLTIPNIIGEPFLYLDLDLLLRKGWDEVSHSYNSEYAVCAREHWQPTPSEFNEDGTVNQAVRVANGRYFNAGVLFINSELWTLRNVTYKVDLVLREHKKLGFRWSDQCILNYLMKGEYGEIPKTFNCTPWELGSRDAKIIHFAGKLKPWRMLRIIQSKILGFRWRRTAGDSVSPVPSKKVPRVSKWRVLNHYLEYQTARAVVWLVLLRHRI